MKRKDLIKKLNDSGCILIEKVRYFYAGFRLNTMVMSKVI
jgi:hypothetical protein